MGTLLAVLVPVFIFSVMFRADIALALYLNGKDSLIYWIGREEYWASADRALVWADPDFAESLGIDRDIIKGYLPNSNHPSKV